MESVLRPRPGFSFFLIIGLIGLFGAFTGFMSTFFVPVSAGTFRAPFVIYLHGAFAFTWIMLFVSQTFFIHFKNYKTHIVFGILGACVALGTAITMVPAGMFATSKELANGNGDISYAQVMGTCTSAILFLTLVTLALLNRNRPMVHKRFMLLATILVLWPAWFRFRHYFPSVPRPDIWFGVVLSDSLIILAWILDKKANGKVHPVLLYGGLFIILENITEILLFNTITWYQWGKLIYNTLSNA